LVQSVPEAQHHQYDPAVAAGLASEPWTLEKLLTEAAKVAIAA